MLEVQALFSEVGEYGIKISLLDKDASNAVIEEKEFTFNVKENAVNDENNGDNNETVTDKNEVIGETENIEEMPENLPKTGMTKYIYIITFVAILGATYFTIKNEKIKKENK